MPHVDEEHFTFTWHIKNFSMCPLKLGYSICSPLIKVSFLEDSEWCLQLNPKAVKKLDTASCYLYFDCIGKCPLNIKYKLCLFGDVGAIEDGQFYKNRRSSKPTIFTLDHIFKNRNHYLPNDTLTILCEITKEGNDVGDFEEGKIRALTHMRYNVTEENLFNSNKCTVETTVEVLRKNVIWPIRRFQTLQVDEKLTVHITSSVEDIPCFYVTFFKGKTESSTHINIERDEDSPFDNVFVKCNASVIDNHKHVMHYFKDEFLFETDEVWKYPTFINLKELCEDKYFERTNDTLYICLDIAFSIEDKWHHLEQNYYEPVKMPKTNVISPVEYRMLTPDEEPGIVRLQTGDRSYEVHRRILKAKSKVFEAMFQNDMKEQKTGIVDIPDVDPDTLGRLMWFFYSNGTEDGLSLADAIKLYSAAHKYQVLPLLSHCSFLVESSLVVSNVTDILSLADLHQDNRLLEATEAFIRANSHRVLDSQDWRDFIKSNGTLAANVMLKMLTNN